MNYFIIFLGYLLNLIFAISSESIYSIIAPGLLKSNHKYMVVVSLHDAPEPATIKIRIQGPGYYMENNVFLQPNETAALIFVLQKLVEGEHKLIAEGISGIQFRNESRLYASPNAGPKIYIQTDKGVYKPGDEVQFRVVILDEHTRSLKIEEPIRVDITDGQGNRIKQFKDIRLKLGIYKDKFQISQYPVMGEWMINVYISGKYDYAKSKVFKVQQYILPKFSVFIKTEGYFFPPDGVFKALIYGKYTFDKYVEGNMTVQLINATNEKVIQEKQADVKDMLTMEFHFQTPEELTNVQGMLLKVHLMEKYTGIQHSDSKFISVIKERYRMYVERNTIFYRDGTPYRLLLNVRHWNGSNVEDLTKPAIMKHGSKEYSAYLDRTGVALFEFDHELNENHVFHYEDSSYILPNIYSVDSQYINRTKAYCKLSLLTVSPRLGNPVEIEVTSNADIPYLLYTIVSHANVIHADQIQLPPNSKSYTIEITPSIEMIPQTYVYVYYIVDGNFYYDEIEVKFPLEFENKVNILAPTQVKPGAEVTLDLKTHPKSYVGLLAVDLGVYLLDSSYDLKKWEILSELEVDKTTTPLLALIYPGLLSGLVTLTNAHYQFVPLTSTSLTSPNSVTPLNFRKKFPETWIFENYETSNGSIQLKLNIPDTITTWRLTAFTVNEITGFGIVNGPTDITTIQKFFINLNLPYSVKRGEIVSIPALIHNYYDEDLDAEITMFNSEQQFYFMKSIESNSKVSEEQTLMKNIKIPANSVEQVTYVINPKQVGDLKLKLTATSSRSSDAIIQNLKVEPEGIRKLKTKSMYISVQPENDFEITLPVNIPPDVVPDSEYITLSVGGDTMVATIKNLNNLVLLPTGCGEQNMVNFAPNILVLQYLRATGKYFNERELVRKAKTFIELGYQQQLSYRHKNGGYSVFGPKKDEEPSAWLTAYVIRFFLKGSKYFPLDTNVIDRGLEYLQQTQLDDGSFLYTGYLFFPAQQNRFGYAAFVLMTFLEDEQNSLKYQKTIEKTLNFLNMNLPKIDDIYALSIMAVAFQMAKHENTQKILDKLMLNRKQDNDFIWFSQNDKNPEKDVEITAYVLIALLETNGRYDDQLLIGKWLIEQINERGGFKSTHDTVVGLQALVKFSEKFSGADNLNMKLKYTAKNIEQLTLKSGEMTVDANNQLILQTEEFPLATRFLDVTATGMGNSLLQLSYHYHVSNDQDMMHFHIQPKPKILNAREMLLETCFTYRQSNAILTTNMIIMEANLPSGFTSNDEFSSELLDNEIVERIESKNEDTTIVIYFKKLSANIKNCLNILASKTYDVLVHKPVAIVVYDYYNITRHDSVFYNI